MRMPSFLYYLCYSRSYFEKNQEGLFKERKGLYGKRKKKWKFFS